MNKAEIVFVNQSNTKATWSELTTTTINKFKVLQSITLLINLNSETLFTNLHILSQLNSVESQILFLELFKELKLV